MLRTLAIVASLLLGISLGQATLLGQTPKVLHTFIGGGPLSPFSALLQANDGNFYGTTAQGGAYDAGTVFRITAAGAITILHDFAGGTGDGKAPYAAVIQGLDGNLYGTTTSGGTSSQGTVYKITLGGVLTTLHSFSGDDGPSYAPLFQNTDGTMYGTTITGTGVWAGTVFKITTVGTYTVLRQFSGAINSPSIPRAALIKGVDGRLYGTTQGGGASGASSAQGAIFSLATDGSGFLVLHTFYSGGTEGTTPMGPLVLANDGFFYGTTALGNAGAGGGIFKMAPTDFAVTVVHSFTPATEGSTPQAGLKQGTDGRLYGTTSGAGASNAGTAFAMTLGGSFTTLHAFTGATEGRASYASIIQASNGSYYGTTSQGGANDVGTVFSMTSGGTLTVLATLVGNAADGGYPSVAATLVKASDGNFYGTTLRGGTGNGGVVFRMTPAGAVTVLHSFGATPAVNFYPADGGYPDGSLMQAGDGNLYGTTRFGGAANRGTVFRITTSGVFTLLHSFAGGSTDAERPNAPLIQGADGFLYGSAIRGGASNIGVVYRMALDGTSTVIYSFTAASNANTPWNLMQATDGNLYGTALGGGGSADGVVFKLTTGGTYTALHAFQPATDGSKPTAPLLQASDGNLYGLAKTGGASNGGSVFKVSLAGSFTTLRSLSCATDGCNPDLAALVQGTDGNLYGTTPAGGASNSGTLFKITPAGTLTVLYTFTSSTAAGTFPGSILQPGDGRLWGAALGGTYALGTVFRLNVSSLPFTDDPLGAGTSPIKAVHFVELRARVNAARQTCGVGAATWTDSSLAAGTPIKAVHLTELRTALSGAYVACGFAAPVYSSGAVSAGTTIKAAHLTELRTLLLAIE